MTVDIDYAFTLFQHMILLFVNRIEVFHVIHLFCSIVCLVLTMHKYTHWLLGHYQPLLNARHLSKCDMMRSLAQQNQTSNLSIGLRQLPSIKGTQWFYKKWNFSFAANQSFRPHMEDRMSYLHVPQTHNVSIYSVFDGHGGAQVADFLEQHFNKRVFLMLEEKEQRIGQDIYKDDELIEQALIDEIGRIDSDVTTSKTSYTGSTLISAMLNHNRYLTVINVGDSRCIGADFEGNLVQLSMDHKPSQPEERARIETAGGFVEHYGVERVNGILAVSRAFGDTDLKRHRFVISKPDITRIDLEKRPLSYILLASDGFWDVVSNHEAILEVNYLLEKRGDFKFSKPEEKKQLEDKPVSQPKSTDTPKKRPIDSPTNKEFGLAVFQAPAVKRPKVEKGVTKEKPTKSNNASEASGSDRSELETSEAEKRSGNALLGIKDPTDSTLSSTKTSSIDANNKKQVDIAAHLVKLALKRRSPDNVSVFFVRLDNHASTFHSNKQSIQLIYIQNNHKMASSGICAYLQSMGDHRMGNSASSSSMQAWNHSVFTAESQISVSRLNRVTYGYIAPVIITVGVVGDILTVATLTHPVLRRSSIIYTYLTLLALTDLFTHVSVVPMIMWLLDMRLCSKFSAFYYAHIGFPLANALMGASVWIVVFLTFSQFLAVCKPFHQGCLRKRRMCFLLFTLAYVSSFCINAPWAAKKSVHIVPPGLLQCPYVVCDRKIETWYRAYEWIRELMTRVFPFLLIAYFNTKILITYRNTKKDRMKRLSCKTRDVTEKSEQEEKRLFVLLFAIVIVFFLCTIPAAPLTIFVADSRSQNLAFQIIRAIVNLLEFTKFALNFYFYCLFNPVIRQICWHMVQCQKLGKQARIKGQPVNPISVYTRSTKSTIRGFPIGHDDLSRRSSQRQMDENYRKSIETKVNRSASLLSAGQFYCETPNEFDQLTVIRESEDSISLLDGLPNERDRLPSFASAIVRAHAGAPSPDPLQMGGANQNQCFLGGNMLLAPPI